MMIDDAGNIRKILSKNIKRHRKALGITQEKLAELAEISANMMNDIEGCRTWVSEKTLTKIATALQTEIYKLFLPVCLSKEEIEKSIFAEFFKNILEVNNNFNDCLANFVKKENKDV